MYSDEQGVFLIAMTFEVCFMENRRWKPAENISPWGYRAKV